MENINKSKLYEEQLRKLKYKTNYKINESPRYRPLVGDNEEFDQLPMRNEAGDQEDAVKPAGGAVPPEPSNDPTVSTEPPVPEFDQNAAPAGEIPPAPDGAVPPPPMDGEVPPPVDAVPQVDDIQNEIIKHNIEAMKSIHDQLEQLNGMTQSLNAKMETLTADVEEVREPTNSEKLMNKSKVSYPYYFNLNDMWTGNWFDEQRNKELSKGIKEMPDGTYVADFDDLPQKSKIDVQNSFNDIQESKTQKKSKLSEGFDSQISNKSEIDGLSDKTRAISYIYRKVAPLTQGFFSDESWENVHKIFKTFDAMNLDWYIDKAEYNGTMPPERKIWYLGIEFTTKMGQRKEIKGYLTAAGAGSKEDPLDRYDITLVLS